MKKKMLIHKVIFICLFFCSCQTTNEAKKVLTLQGHAMTMNYKIIIENRLENMASVQEVILKTFDEIDTIYNKWNENSEISALNRLEKKTTVPISKELESFLTETKKLVFLSNGLFDPTIEPLQRLWKKYLKTNSIPSEIEIQEKMQMVGFDKIHFENGTFYKDFDETSLDLGGIAKGYAVDLLASRLNDLGYKNTFIEWGGEIKATGRHPDNRPWHIFISRFQNTSPEDAIAHIELENEAIATSGDYLQNWTVEKNKNYFHIVNPKTGYLAEIKENSIASASVIAKSCLVADALATTLMLFDEPQEATKWLEGVKEHYDGIKVWIVTR